MTRRFRPVVERIEDRLTPAWTGPVTGLVVLLPTAEAGQYRVIGVDGTDLGDITPFSDGFSGEVRTAVGDVTGDFRPDLIVAAGPGGGSRVRVFDGVTLAPVADFFAFEPTFRGGVYVAAGDVNRDGHADIVVGAGEGGGPVVKVFDGHNPGAVLTHYFAFEPSFRGGVRVAAGDVDPGGYGYGAAEVVAGAGPGGAPRVSVARADGTPVTSFFAYEPGLRSGVSVAITGGSTLDGGQDVVLTAPGAGGGPLVKVFDGTTGGESRSFVAGDPDDRGGRLITADRSGWFFAATPGAGGTDLAVYSTTGQSDWSLPAGQSRVRGLILGVDLAARTVTIRVPDEPGDLALAYDPATSTFRLPAGTDRTIALGPGTTITRDGAPAQLSDLRADEFLRDELDFRASADGHILSLSARPAGYRLPPVE